MIDKFLFGFSPETILVFLFIVIILIILLARRDTKGIAAMAATIPIFWLFSKKFGSSEKELAGIKAEYDTKLEALRKEFNKKMEVIRSDIQRELNQHQFRAEAAKHKIDEVDTASKQLLDRATPEELEELAKGLLAIPGKEGK